MHTPTLSVCRSSLSLLIEAGAKPPCASGRDRSSSCTFVAAWATMPQQRLAPAGLTFRLLRSSDVDQTGRGAYLEQVLVGGRSRARS